MRVNLLHNKIVMDTVSDKFIESFNKLLLPRLTEKYPKADAVVLYEDYLSDGFKFDSSFYCPLTLVEGDKLSYVFVSWRVNSSDFEGSVPYSYIGKGELDFEICDEPPLGFKERLSDREPYLAEHHISLTVETGFGDKTFLSGKYSQSFIDLMAEALTRAVEEDFSITGAAESSLEFRLVFSPVSFMEHVVDNVTYRRILIAAKSCAPRDLWIKWTRLDGEGSYTVSDSVTAADIVFELAEDVSERIREKEYRYLINSASFSAYKNAMSRKNFMEWRELVKRVIKRGEVIKCDAPAIPEAPLTEEAPQFEAPIEDAHEKNEGFAFEGLSLSLGSILDADVLEDNTEEEEINPDIKELLRGLISQVPSEDAEDSEEAPEAPGENELPPFEIDGEGLSIESETEYAEDEIENTADGGDELIEYPEENEDAREEYAAIAELEALDASPSDIQADEDTLTLDDEPCDDVTDEPEAPAHCSPEVQKIINDIDYDRQAAFARDVERREIDALKAENNKLSALVEEREREIELLQFKIEASEEEKAELRGELASLREAFEAKRRAEEREKDRIAEAAKLRVEEQRRAAADVDLDEERRRKEEAERLEREEKEARLEAERREREAREALQKEEAERAARAAREAELRRESVNYVSKTADLIFRSPVDPNITKRIQEIVVTTVKYFDKQDVYMKIKASIPEPNMVRLDFLKIPDNESELLTDIIRVLGHSKLGITKVLLD